MLTRLGLGNIMFMKSKHITKAYKHLDTTLKGTASVTQKSFQVHGASTISTYSKPQT